MNIAGLGVVFAGGRGMKAFENALQKGWDEPTWRENPRFGEGTYPIYGVSEETLTDRSVLKGVRRADRFTKMAVLAAWDAVEASGLPLEEVREDLGVIVSSAFGPQATTFAFLDEIIDYGDAGVSPTRFSFSVHNAAASYVTKALDCRGPAITVSNFFSSIHQALILARAWLAEGRCRYVLVGSVEETGPAFEYLFRRKLKISPDGRIRPFLLGADSVTVVGEGSVFLLLTGETTDNTYCRIENVALGKTNAIGQADLCLLDTDGLVADERIYRPVARSAGQVASYAPLYGGMPTGSAFHCAAAALILHSHRIHRCPDLENPEGLNLCEETGTALAESVNCIRYNCEGRAATIRLRQHGAK